jgi:hypothetical protein
MPVGDWVKRPALWQLPALRLETAWRQLAAEDSKVADEKRRMAAVKLLIFRAAVGLPAVLRLFLEEQKN